MRRVLGALFVVAASACSLFIPFSEYDARPDAGGDGGCGADKESDVLNCGACGHECRGEGCVKGLCLPTRIPAADTFRAQSVSVDEDAIFVGGFYDVGDPVFGAIFRQPKNDPIRGVEVQGRLGAVNAMAFFGDRIYWSDIQGTLQQQVYSLAHARKTGGAKVERVIESAAVDLVVDDSGTYWRGGNDALLRRRPLGGAVSETVAAGVNGRFDVDATDVYYATIAPIGDRPGSIVARPKTLAAPRTLVPDLLNPIAVAIDETHVFFAEAATGNGSLAKVPKSGGATTTLVPDLQRINFILVAGEHVYVFTGTTGDTRPDGRILRITKDGSSILPLAVGTNPQSAAVDAEHVYWVEKGERVLYRVGR